MPAATPDRQRRGLPGVVTGVSHRLGALCGEPVRHWLLERLLGSSLVGAAAGAIAGRLDVDHEVGVGIICGAVACVGTIVADRVSRRTIQRPPVEAIPRGRRDIQPTPDEIAVIEQLGGSDGFCSRRGDLYQELRDGTGGWTVARFRQAIQILRADGYLVDVDGDEAGRFFIPDPVCGSEAWIEIALTEKGRCFWAWRQRGKSGANPS